MARRRSALGAITCAASFADLLAFGLSKYTPKPRRDVFVESWDKDPLTFWQGLVILWMLALHEMIKPTFDAVLASIVTKDELHPGPLKGLPRILEKTREYVSEKGLTKWSDKVLAPLYVIDIVRATVQVETAPTPNASSGGAVMGGGTSGAGSPCAPARASELG